MTDFYARAMDILPMPALLFEAGDHRFIHANQAARRLRLTDLAHALDAMDAEFNLKPHLRQTELHAYRDSAFTLETPWGYAAMSIAGPPPAHSRPDLILVTFHVHAPQHEASSEHMRVRMCMHVNECADDALASLRAAQQWISDVVASQRVMRDFINDTFQDLMERNVREVSPNRLTGLPALAEG